MQPAPNTKVALRVCWEEHPGVPVDTLLQSVLRLPCAPPASGIETRGRKARAHYGKTLVLAALVSDAVCFAVAGGFGWRMTDDEVAALDRASAKVPPTSGAPFEKW